MGLQKAKASTILCGDEVDALGIVIGDQANDTRVATPHLLEIQASFVTRRMRLRPNLARLIAEICFDRCSA